jgi:hypothetical protein
VQPPTVRTQIINLTNAKIADPYTRPGFSNKPLAALSLV